MTETWTIEQARTHFATKPHRPKKKKPSNKSVGEMKLLLKIEGIEVVEEYKFSDTRKFRFDFAIPDKKIGIEYEGIFSGKSRHTTITGYSRDTEKYNLAVAEGWMVLRYTAMTYGKVIEDLKKLL